MQKCRINLVKNKIISLFELTKLLTNKDLSEKYINYVCGFNSDHRYRHDELNAINTLIETLNLDDCSADGFIYGYSVPQLNKEFDLIKVGEERCVNIEIKSRIVSEDKIIKQLRQNRHYLKMLNVDVFLFSFVAETKTYYRLLDDDSLSICEYDTVRDLLSFTSNEKLDLDEVFKPSNILVSPLNDSERFFRHQYLLTEDQENKKELILHNIEHNNTQRFYGLTGGAGTGKTLLLYDIAFELASTGKKVLIVHSGKMCDGHAVLNERMDTLRIIEAKELRYREIRGLDLIVVDESQRIYTTIMEKIERWVNKADKKCLFAFDETQIMSKRERNRNTPELIRALCTEQYLFKLTNKIRTNKEIAAFITCLRDLSKRREGYVFKNVTIQYEPSKRKSVEIAKEYERKGYKYIAYTSSFYYSDLDYQSSLTNTHYVIGQEFDGVVMILNERFYYEDNKLNAYQHPNPDFIYTKLLYQGLTRARTKLHLIIQREELLSKIMLLFEANED